MAQDRPGSDGREEHDAREREARRILERVEVDSESFGTSSLARSAGRARDHFLGADADPEDRAEVWGRRIGRLASLVVTIVLLFWLVGWLTRRAAGA